MQRAVAHFIGSGALARHIRRCHTAYSSRREKILSRLSLDLSPWLALIPSVDGFHLTAAFQRHVDVDLLCRIARRMEVGLYPSDPFYHGPVREPALFFGFGAIDAIGIDAALDRAHQVLAEKGD